MKKGFHPEINNNLTIRSNNNNNNDNKELNNGLNKDYKQLNYNQLNSKQLINKSINHRINTSSDKNINSNKNTSSNKKVYSEVNNTELNTGLNNRLNTGLNTGLNSGLNKNINKKLKSDINNSKLNPGLNTKLNTELNKSSNKKLNTNLITSSTQNLNQIVNPFNMKPPEYKDNYRESINEIITINSRLAKLFKSLTVSTNYTITFNNLPKTYIDTLKNSVNLATEDYVLSQINTAELGDLSKTVNFKNKDISFITNGSIQLQNNILNTIDNEGLKCLNVNYLNDLSINDVEPTDLEEDNYCLYYNTNENNIGYILYKYEKVNQLQNNYIWKEFKQNNLICIVKSNKLLLKYYNEQWNNLINYVFLDEITINLPSADNYKNEVIFFKDNSNNDIEYNLYQSVFIDYDEQHNEIWEWKDYFKINNINKNIYYCIIKNEDLNTTLYKYTLNNNKWIKIEETEIFNTNKIINYVVIDKIINFSNGNLKCSNGIFDNITIGNPDVEGEFNVYYKDDDNVETNITKHNIIETLKKFNLDNTDIKCKSILVSNNTEEQVEFNSNDILYARYETINENIYPLVDISNININGIVNVNKNGNITGSDIEYVNLNDLLYNLQFMSEQLTFIKSINADDNSIIDINSYGKIRCNTLNIPNVLDISNKEDEQVTDEYHIKINDVIPELNVSNIGLPSDYYNLFKDESFITKRYFDGNQSTNITTPAYIGTNETPGKLNLYGVDVTKLASVSLYYQTRDNVSSNDSNTTFNMFEIDTNIHNISSKPDNTFKINNMVITKHNNSTADISGINTIEINNIEMSEISLKNNINDDKMKITYTLSEQENIMKFSFYNLNPTPMLNDLLQLKYTVNNNIEITTNGNITGKNFKTTNEKIQFYEDENIGIISLDKLITNNNGLEIIDKKTSEQSLTAESFYSNVEIQAIKKQNNTFESYIKLKDINNNNNNYIEFNNYTNDITNNIQQLPTLYIENGQIQMGNEDNKKFYVDKTGKIKCLSVELDDNITCKSITIKNNNTTIISLENNGIISANEFKTNDNKIEIKDNYSINNTLYNITRLYDINYNPNSNPLNNNYIEFNNYSDDLSVSSNPSKIPTLYIENGQIQMKNDVFHVDKTGKLKCSSFDIYNGDITCKNIICDTITLKSQDNLFEFLTQQEENSTQNQQFIIKDLQNNNNNCLILDRIQITSQYNSPTYTYSLKSYGFETFGYSDNNPKLKIENNGNLTSYGTLSTNEFKTNDNKIEIKDNHSINDTSYNIARLYDINYDPNSNPPTNNNYIEFNNYSDDLSISSNPPKIPTLYIENGQIKMQNNVFTVDKEGKITGNQIVLNNNGSSSLNSELNEDTQSKKYTKINNESIQLFNYDKYIFIYNSSESKQNGIYIYENNTYTITESTDNCIDKYYKKIYLYSSSNWTENLIYIQSTEPPTDTSINYWLDISELDISENILKEKNESNWITSSKNYKIYKCFQNISDSLQLQQNININSDGNIDLKSINIKDDNNYNKIYVGKYINDTDDDTNKLIKIMYDVNKSYVEIYSDNGTGRKQKLLIDDSNIETNNNIKIKDNNNNLWLSIEKDNGITIQQTVNNTIYKNKINYDSLIISTITGSEEEEQIKLSANGTITANEIHSTNYLTVDNNIYITKISNNSDEYIKFEVRRSGQQSLYAFLKLSTSDTPPSS